MCNRYLLDDFLTTHKVEFHEFAHIQGDSPLGPRGNVENSHNVEIENLLFLCPTCHLIIDNNPEEHPLNSLIDMKRKHEERVMFATGQTIKKQVLPITFLSKIGKHEVTINDEEIREAIISDGFLPSDGNVIDLSSKSTVPDGDKDYYKERSRDLLISFIRYETLIKKSRVMLFALAPMPLLFLLGTLLKKDSTVFIKQRSRTQQSWVWETKRSSPIIFKLKEPEAYHSNCEVALSISLSANIEEIRVKTALPNCDLWEIHVDFPNHNLVKTKKDIESFSQFVEMVFSSMQKCYGNEKPFHIFPAMPASLAIEFGRSYMSKAYNPLVVYDSITQGHFQLSLKIPYEEG